MLILPAIDILGGKCVRLYQGDYSRLIQYCDDPMKMAASFREAGAKFIHIVDLEGAKTGRTINAEIALQIARELNVDVQFGGGIRSYEDARDLLQKGIKRVILGSAAIENPGLAGRLVREFGRDRVAVSVDVRNGKVALQGWTEDSGKNVEEVLEELAQTGVEMIIFTDISRDGAMKGVNFESVGRVLESEMKVIMAGGVGSISDIRKLEEMGAYGAIIGKALYEGKLDLRECFKTLKSDSDEGGKNRMGEWKNFLAKRIIPCMDVKDGRVVKGTYFRDFRDAGDPVELGREYSEMGADELIFLDIMATVENRDTLYRLVERISENINIPFTVGGGVSSVEDVRNLLNAGADKVAIESAAIWNPDLIRQVASKFGSQCIVVSMAPKKVKNGWELFVRGGRTATGVDAVEFAEKMEGMGAGELLVNSLDRDGTKKGYDIELLKAISEVVNIPVIASSGAGKCEDFLEAFCDGNCDAALAASLFHYKELTIEDLKNYLRRKGVSVRI